MGVRTACTPFLIFRGRTRHELGVQGWLRRVAQAANFRHAVYGPSELFYGELYSSQDVDCRPTLARPGTRDPYSGCVGALRRASTTSTTSCCSRCPTTTTTRTGSGRRRPSTSIARADRHLAELAEPAGGIERFLDDHAVILMADHAQIAVSERINLRPRSSDWQVLQPNDPATDGAELAVAPGARSAMVYVLDPDTFAPRALGAACSQRLQEHRGRRGGRLDDDGEEACVWTERGELRFAPGGARARPPRRGLGRRGHARDARARDARRRARRAAPTRTRCARHLVGARRARAPATCWSRPRAATSSWTGAAPTTSAAAATARCVAATRSRPLAFVNCGPTWTEPSGEWPAQWSIADVAPIVSRHFEQRG